MLPILASLVAVAATAAAQADDSSLVSQLVTANSQVNRIKDIANDKDFVFDFLAGSRGTAQGGFAVGANSANFPALLTGNGAMTVGVMGPCGANSPHIHPRATELQIVVQGGPIYTEMIQENGARTVKNNVPLGSATIFPVGSIHFQQNMGCEPTVFVASFDSVDPGTSQIAQNFFALDKGVVNATLGGIGVSVLDNLNLPMNFILGAQECLDRCKIDRSTFNFTATFKDYAAFSNSTWATPPPLPSSVSAMYGGSGANATDTSMPLTSTGGAKNAAFLAGGNADIPFAQNPLRPAVIGLGSATAALLIALVGMLVMMACRRRSGVKVAPRFPGGSSSSGQGYPYVTPYDDTESLASRRSMAKA